MVEALRKENLIGIGAEPGDTACDVELIGLAGSLRRRYEEAMECYAPHKALEEVFKVIQRANKYIDENVAVVRLSRLPRSLARSTLMVWIRASLEKLPSEPKGNVRSRKKRRASTPNISARI